MTITSKHPATIIETDVVTLIPWADHRKDVFGHDLRSAYVEQFWLGTLGPSTTWFLRHCAAVLEDADDAAVNLRETACALGIGFEGGSRSAMVKTVARACRFRAARAVGDTTLAVRLRLPQLSHRQLQRLPASVQQRHEEYLAGTGGADGVRNQQLRARRLALGLVECGDDLSETELQLSRLKFHPAIAADAVRWAWSLHHGRVPPEAA